jgi:hypothetical protein
MYGYFPEEPTGELVNRRGRLNDTHTRCFHSASVAIVEEDVETERHGGFNVENTSRRPN